MKKKFKFNFKLTACLVSFFIGILFIILSNKSNVCIFFGFIFLAAAIVFFALYSSVKEVEKLQELDKLIQQNDRELDKFEGTKDEEELELIDQLSLETAYLYKQRKYNDKRNKRAKIIFFTTAIFFVLLGFLILFS